MEDGRALVARDAAYHNSSSPSMPAPIAKILAVPELCEIILQYLTFDELIPAQLVCRGLIAVIRGSIELQRILFLMPALPTKDSQWVTDYKNRLRIGKEARPFLEKMESGSKNYNAVTPLICNPLLSSRRHDYIKQSRSPSTAIAVSINDHVDRPHHAHEYFEFKIDKFWMSQPYHSCRSMFLTQPPVTRVDCEPAGRCEHTRRETAYLNPGWCKQCAGDQTVINPEGVTLGQVLDRLLSRAGQGKGFQNDKLRFPGAFVVTAEIADRVNGMVDIREKEILADGQLYKDMYMRTLHK